MLRNSEFVGQRFEKVYWPNHQGSDAQNEGTLDKKRPPIDCIVPADIMSQSHCFENMQIRRLDVLCLRLEP